MKLVLSYLLSILLFTNVVAQKPTFQTNPSLNFTSYLSGVKYAEIVCPPEFQDQVDNGKGVAGFYQLAKSYLQSIGISNVVLTTQEKLQAENNVKSYCEKVSVLFSGDISKNRIGNLSVTYVTCQNDIFLFQSNQVFSYKGLIGAQPKIMAVWKSLYAYKVSYDSSAQLNIASNHTEWTESNVRNYIVNTKTDNIEGIYERIRINPEDYQEGKYKIAIVKDKSSDDFLVIYLSGAKNKADWKEGEIKGRIVQTGTPGFYKASWLNPIKVESDESYAFVDEYNMLNMAVTGQSVALFKFLKLYPLNNNSSAFKSSGSGFAVSKNGLIATNAHVIANANSISVSIVLNDSVHNYKAVVVAEDKKNDLALIQIEDNSFRPFKELPYGFNQNELDKGENVFVLGYPLITTMGEGIKLTNGIISSNSGYQGDPNTYQISAPVQPGNSGGPMFDSNGNVVGIVSAKHMGAENATYVIKLKQLNQLIANQSSDITQAKTELSSLPMKDQVKNVSGYVFLIRVN